MSKPIIKVMYVTWDGPQVNYLETLFLPIFKRLSEVGFDFHVLQFTWGESSRVQATRRACLAAGFPYRAEHVCRWPVGAGSFLTAVAGAASLRQMIKRGRFDVVLPRSTMPALSTSLAVARSPIPVVFDADGLPIDERVDFGGLRRGGIVYRLLSAIEKRAVRNASVVLTRTGKAADILRERSGRAGGQPIFRVVRNGRDPELFSPGESALRARTREDLGVGQESPLMIYAGSIGPQYCLSEMLQFFSFVHSKVPNSRLLVLTGSPEPLHKGLEAFPHLSDSVITMRVPAEAVPEYLAAADVGLALRRPSFSMQGVAPIKLGEYLLCGLPVVATEGIGDTESIITSEVGFLTRTMDESELKRAAEWFLGTVIPDREGFRACCRQVGLRECSLDAAVEDYRHALELAATKSIRRV